VALPRNVGLFVRARRGRWERLAALVDGADAGRLSIAEVEELDRLYRRAAGDLAHARVAFAGSDAEGFLAQLTARAYGALYRRRAGKGRALRRLYLEEVPAAARRSAGAIGLAAALLVAGIAGGALAVALDEGAAAVLVPDPVRDALAARRMWTESLLGFAPGVAGAGIAHNNLTVAALAFVLGIGGGLGTAWLLLANGILLGAVGSLAARRGMAGPFLGFVAAHGPVELSAIVLAGGAGFLLAQAVILPGEWPRAQALSARGRDAARLLAAVVPALAFVALVESAISPARTIPVPGKAILGLGLAAGLWAYLLRPATAAGATSTTSAGSASGMSAASGAARRDGAAPGT
jgi:uncharacterized membrane protein SpoIIM required for sporulation